MLGSSSQVKGVAIAGKCFKMPKDNEMKSYAITATRFSGSSVGPSVHRARNTKQAHWTRLDLTVLRGAARSALDIATVGARSNNNYYQQDPRPKRLPYSRCVTRRISNSSITRPQPRTTSQRTTSRSSPLFAQPFGQAHHLLRHVSAPLDQRA